MDGDEATPSEVFSQLRRRPEPERHAFAEGFESALRFIERSGLEHAQAVLDLIRTTDSSEEE